MISSDLGKEIIKNGYKTGKGSFKIRGEIEFEEKKMGDQF